MHIDVYVLAEGDTSGTDLKWLHVLFLLLFLVFLFLSHLKSLTPPRFKSNRDAICHEYSSRKYASTDGVRLDFTLSRWRPERSV